MTETNKIHAEIDGKSLDVDPGMMIIEVADKAGISIPRFCYHKKLSIAANCRMCLVEVEKSPKELPACATPVTDGMRVWTHSKRALMAQKAVMEFLLINHPLDCPICDQGGECELQDVSLGYGKDISRYNEGKRTVQDKDIGPLISTDLTRCIHCTRCVRFGEEIAGLRELGATGRGENMTIGTYIEHSVQSELSGNVIDLCPVGALTSKPFRFKARAWELQQFPSVAPHDCLGSNIHVHVRRNEVMRVVPRENEALNETWLSDRDRFSYVGVNSEQRLQRPMIKQNGVWKETDWEYALNFVVNRLNHIKDVHGSEQIAGLASSSNTLEELFLFQKWLRGMGVSSIDHRVRQTDSRDQMQAPLFPRLEIPFADIEEQDAIFVVGANIQREQPLLAHRLRKATLRGANVMFCHAIAHPVNFALSEKIIVSSSQIVSELAAIARILSEKTTKEMSAETKNLLKAVPMNETTQAIAERLIQTPKSLILMGAFAANHPEASTIRALSQLIAKLTDSAFGELTEGANAAGAWIAGVLPHREAGGVPAKNLGKSAKDILTHPLKAYVLMGLEPELDTAVGQHAKQSLQKAEFVMAFTAFHHDALKEYAHVLLPIVPFTETAGTYVNLEGLWQSFQPCIHPLAEAKPAWKILRVLGNLLTLNGFDYQSADQVLTEIKQIFMHHEKNPISSWYCPSQVDAKPISGVQRLTEWAIYSVDPIVRRSIPLQESKTQEKPLAHINQKLAQQLSLSEGSSVRLTQGEYHCITKVTIDDSVSDHSVLTYAGMHEFAQLGHAFGEIGIQAHEHV